MDNDVSNSQITANISDGSITVEMSTDYGPIVFSYSPNGVENGIANLVADVLRQSGDSDETPFKTLAETGLPEELVKRNAEIYDRRAKIVFPTDALEKFVPGSKAYSQGTLEQFSENLRPAILLMLDHLGAAALVLGKAELDGQSSERVDERRRVLLNNLRDHFRASIQALWD